MAKRLRVHRKGYHRKDGTYVKPTTYYVKDKGAKGRTPRKEQWFEPGEPLGWSKDDPVKKRRATALRSRGGDALATARALQALANVTTDRETKREAQKDANYFFSLHKRTK